MSDVDGMSEEERLAAEWAALAEEDDEFGDGDAPTRVLNQDEIDSLLGFDQDDDDGSETSGVKALVNSALVNYERLPMLEVEGNFHTWPTVAIHTLTVGLIKGALEYPRDL